VDTIKGWFGVWNNYAQVIDGIREDARSLMPYAAAWIDKDSRILGQKQYEPIFRQFNQTLWNWLYANAKEAQASASSDVPLKAHTRAVLFPEVVPENPKMIRASLLGRLFTFKPWS
jgi:succinate dehydrogenase flavin-adding protein (antitoxin of CptAB toxin-antitoxin module)